MKHILENYKLVFLESVYINAYRIFVFVWFINTVLLILDLWKISTKSEKPQLSILHLDWLIVQKSIFELYTCRLNHAISSETSTKKWKEKTKKQHAFITELFLFLLHITLLSYIWNNSMILNMLKNQCSEYTSFTLNWIGRTQTSVYCSDLLMTTTI